MRFGNRRLKLKTLGPALWLGLMPLTVFAQCSNAVTFGLTAASGVVSGINGRIDGTQYTLSQSTTVTTEFLYMSTAAGSGVAGIYSNNGGVPQNLLVQGSAKVLAVGWNQFNLPVTVLPAGTYWLMFEITSSTDQAGENDGTVGDEHYSGYAYTGVLPAAFPGGGSSGYFNYEIYVMGCPGPLPLALTPTPSAVLKVTPNPFTPGISPNDTAHFNLPLGHGAGQLQIADLKRKRIRSLNFNPGADVQWDGKDDSGQVVSSGVYIYFLQSDAVVHRGTVTVMR